MSSYKIYKQIYLHINYLMYNKHILKIYLNKKRGNKNVHKQSKQKIY